MTQLLLPALQTSVDQRSREFALIDNLRREELDQLAEHIAEKLARSDELQLTFICTHNSRRSHLAQLWAAVAAQQYHLDAIRTFSGGTEATAFFPAAIEALRGAGFEIERARAQESGNPVYAVTFAETLPPILCFSKVYDQPPNPTKDYTAVLVCDHADQSCPVVQGADKRFVVRYLDPKASDGSPEQAETYAERCSQIAREMLYLFSRVKRSDTGVPAARQFHG